MELALFGGKPVIEYEEQKVLPAYIKVAVNKYIYQDGELSIAGKQGVIGQLENIFSEEYKQKYAISLNSGTNCIFSALFALGVGDGDEVIAPAYGFHACISSIFLLRAVPVFCDCEDDNVNMSAEKLESLITSRTKAIVVVHNWGAAADIEKIVEIAHERNIAVIEDCSHAHGSKYKNKNVGQFGDISVFSLQANKTVYAGEGGILLTSNEKIYKRALLLGRYRAKGYINDLEEDDLLETGYGLKFRMHPLGAVIAISTFEHMDEIINERNTVAGMLNDVLTDLKLISPPVIKEYVTRHSYYGYKPLFNDREKGLMNLYVEALQKEGVNIHIATYRLNPDLSLFKGEYRKVLGSRNTIIETDISNARLLNSRIMSLELPTGNGCIDITKRYIDAFYKVENNLDKLRKVVG